MTEKRRRGVRCAVTGVEVPLDDAFVLDVTAARQRVRELRSQLATLQRAIDNFNTTVVEVGGPTPRRYHARVMFSLGVAAAFDAGVTRDLFIPWPEHLRRAAGLLAQRLLSHPQYGRTLRALDPEQRERAMSLGRRIVGRVTMRSGQVDGEARLALSCAVGASLREMDIDAAMEHLLAADEGGLLALGVPSSLVKCVHDALVRCREHLDGEVR